jgi:hypothetical protein
MEGAWEIGSLLAGGVAVIGLIWTLKQDRNTRFLEFIKDVDGEIAEHIKNDEKLENYNECVTHAYVYLEILDRIAFLLDKRKIPSDFSEYYKNYFNYGVTMMIWYVFAWQDKHTIEENWPSLIGWFKKNTLNPYPIKHLPTMLDNKIQDLNCVDIFEKIINKLRNKSLDDDTIKELNDISKTEISASSLL